MQINYEQLLEVFWELHNPTSQPYLAQYRNAIFYLDKEQKRLAEASRQALETRLGKEVNTPVQPAGEFTPAEDYHQKHFLQRVKPVVDVLRKRYPTTRQLFLSTEAARLNGFIGCYGEPTLLGDELRKLNLPAALELDLFDSLTLSCRNFRGKGCSLPPPRE